MSSTTTADNAGYNQGFNRSLRNKRWVRRAYKLVLLSIPVMIFAYFMLSYVSRLPRERHARHAGFFEKVKLGFERAMRGSYLVLVAPHNDAKSSKLPVVELYMRGKRLDKLKEDLPYSGREYQKAELKIDNKEYKVSARYRGDSINHWAFPQKSWRIKLGKDKFYEGMKYLNLNVPRVKTQISNWLGYELAKSFPGLLVPESNYVHFRLNRIFDGVRVFVEQIDQEFLSRRNLPAGKIFIGDISFEHIYGAQERKHIYKETDAWGVRPVHEADMGREEMQELLRIIREEHNPYRFYNQIQEILDVDSTLAYMALLELVGSVHIDETHNGKYYFNPVRGKFNPVVWDTVAYFWKNKGLDLATNSLFRVLLANPEFRERKDQFLWNAVNGSASTSKIRSLINKKVADIRPDVESFALKLHANDKGVRHISNEEWDASIEELKRNIATRNTMIKRYLRDSSASYRLDKKSDTPRFALEVKSAAGVLLEEVRIKLEGATEGQQVKLTRVGLEDIEGPLDESKKFLVGEVNRRGVVAFSVNDHLFSKRRFPGKRQREIVPATYVYTLSLPDGAAVDKVVRVRAKNSVTKEDFTIRRDDALRIPRAHKANSVWWKPDNFMGEEQISWKGTTRLASTKVIGKGQKLTIAPGSKVELMPDVSLVIDGGTLVAVGTADAPIVFQAAEPGRGIPWGVLGAQDANVELAHVIVRGGSEARVSFTDYAEGVSFHNSKVSVRDSYFEGNSISVLGSKLNVEKVRFSSPRKELVLSENSIVNLKDIKREGYDPIHSLALLKQEAFGTPRRTEREFKFRIFGEGITNVEAEALSWEVHKALDNSIKNDLGSWSAPKHPDVQAGFWHDEDVGDFVFRDIYYDTPEKLAEKYAISYRFRNRYSSMKNYEYHVKHPNWSRVWPYRLEYQAKVERKELGNGFSTVEEARFEFRKESAPFSEKRLPPPPPWDVDLFTPYFEAGHYKGIPTYPAKEVVQYLVEREGAKDYRFEPRAVVLTERFRQHLNIKTPWGSGPNPEQAYILSLDNSIVYEAKSYLEYLKAKKYGDKKAIAPPPAGSLLEVEVEFERNVSDKLDREIRLAEKEGRSEDLTRLVAAREAFLADQQHIMKVIQEHFSGKQIQIEPVSKSKFIQAVGLL